MQFRPFFLIVAWYSSLWSIMVHFISPLWMDTEVAVTVCCYKPRCRNALHVHAQRSVVVMARWGFQAWGA